MKATGYLGFLTMTLVGGAFAATPVSAAPSCADTGYSMGCDLDCLVGQTLAASGSGTDSDGWVSASCQGASAGCGFNQGLLLIEADSPSCTTRGTSRASRSGDGDCSGNSGGGTGRIICAAGDGDGGLLDALTMANGGASCSEVAASLDSQVTSFVYKALYPATPAQTIFSWSIQSGCHETELALGLSTESESVIGLATETASFITETGPSALV